MFNIILNTIEKIKDSDKKYSDLLISLLEEESHSFGLKSHNQTTNYFYKELEKIYNTDIIEYCLIERGILYEKDAKAEFSENDNTIIIESLTDLSTYIDNTYDNQDNKLLTILLEGHKLLQEASFKTADTLRNFCDSNFCDKGTLFSSYDITLLLDYIEEQIIFYIESKFNKKYIKEELEWFIYEIKYSNEEFKSIEKFSEYLCTK